MTLAIGLASLAGCGSALSEAGPVAAAQPAERIVSLSGFTRARAVTPLIAEESGRVQAVFGDIGDALDDEGRFVQLDPTFIRLDIEELAAQQDRMTSQIAFARREVVRYRELAKAQNTSASELDSLEHALRDDTHALRALDVKRRIAEERLARTIVRGPAGWRVTARSVEPGQWVAAGAVLGRAADFSTLLAPFALTPEQLAALDAQSDGLGVELTDLGLTLPAKVYRVNPGFDVETRKVAVELALRELPPGARGGLRVALPLRLPVRSGAVRLPARAVRSSYDEHWVERENGERVPVILLQRAASRAGEAVVVSPALEVGDRLRIFEER